MKTFKAKDVYIVRPLKLVKINKQIKFEFPYNILYKMGLIETDKNELMTIMEKDHQSVKEKLTVELSDYQKQFPKFIVADSAICQTTKDFIADANKITLATLNLFLNSYTDIFSLEQYAIDNIACDCDNSEYVINLKCTSPERLSDKIKAHKIVEAMTTRNLSRQEFIDFLESKEYENETYTLDELEKIRDDLKTQAYDLLYTRIDRTTEVFYDARYDFYYSYNAKGEKIKPLSNSKIKKKILK